MNLVIFIVFDRIIGKDSKGDVVMKRQERDILLACQNANTRLKGIGLPAADITFVPLINLSNVSAQQKNWKIHVERPMICFGNFYPGTKSYDVLDALYGNDLNVSAIYERLERLAFLEKKGQKYHEGNGKEYIPLPKRVGQSKTQTEATKTGDENSDSEGASNLGEAEKGFKFRIPLIDDLYDAATNFLNEKVKLPLLVFGAAASGGAALTSDDPNKQIGLGLLSGYLTIKAVQQGFKFPKVEVPQLELPKPKLLAIPKVGAIGWMGVQHTHWVAPYAIFPTSKNGFQSKTNLSHAQGKAGVYQIKRNGEIIYIGKGSNVYKTCLRHFEPYPAEHENKQDFHKDYTRNDYKVRITLTGTIERAKKIEAMLLMKHKPRFNKHIPHSIPFMEKEEYVPF